MILAIDLGGTEVKMGRADRLGNLYETISASVSFDGYKTPLLTTVLKTAETFLASWPDKPEGIAVSACGQVDSEAGVVIGTNGNIPGYEGTKLKAALEEAFGVKTRALNDANAAVLGEAFTGRAKGLRDVLMITLGTGVGGGVITGGRLLDGRRGIAGELGQFTLGGGALPENWGSLRSGRTVRSVPVASGAFLSITPPPPHWCGSARNAQAGRA